VNLGSPQETLLAPTTLQSPYHDVTLRFLNWSLSWIWSLPSWQDSLHIKLTPIRDYNFQWMIKMKSQFGIFTKSSVEKPTGKWIYSRLPSRMEQIYTSVLEWLKNIQYKQHRMKSLNAVTFYARRSIHSRTRFPNQIPPRTYGINHTFHSRFCFSLEQFLEWKHLLSILCKRKWHVHYFQVELFSHS
jgi:hypothetical protein